jgi:hypothetical protein
MRGIKEVMSQVKKKTVKSIRETPEILDWALAIDLMRSGEQVR